MVRLLCHYIHLFEKNVRLCAGYLLSISRAISHHFIPCSVPPVVRSHPRILIKQKIHQITENTFFHNSVSWWFNSMLIVLMLWVNNDETSVWKEICKAFINYLTRRPFRHKNYLTHNWSNTVVIMAKYYIHKANNSTYFQCFLTVL